MSIATFQINGKDVEITSITPVEVLTDHNGLSDYVTKAEVKYVVAFIDASLPAEENAVRLTHKEIINVQVDDNSNFVPFEDLTSTSFVNFAIAAGQNNENLQKKIDFAKVRTGEIVLPPRPRPSKYKPLP